MKKNVYTLRDLCVGYTGVILDDNDVSAIRGFKYALQNPDSIMFASPKDFSLMKIGEFDCDTGIITALPNPELVMEGIKLVERGVVNDL